MTTKKYYSYKTFYPEEIYGSYVTPYNEVFNNLEELTDADLEELGFYPIELPEGLYKIKNWEGKYPPEEYWTYSYTWYRPTMEFIVEEKSLEQKISQINYNQFWNDFSETIAYDRIREQSMISLPVNTVVTELISLFSDAKNDNIKVDRIQRCLTFLLENIEFTEDELQEIQEIFVGTGMHYQYIIANEN
jgi:hypothetical protein